jgi:hypothetical protein
MAAGDVRPYSADQMLVTFAGVNLLEGLADGEFFRWEREADDFDDQVGTDGEVTRSKTNDGRVSCILVLMHTSPINDVLSALINADLAAPGGVGIAPLLVKELQGTTLLSAPKAWIKSRPSPTRDRTATSVEWTIRCAATGEIHGGLIAA